MNKWPTLIFSGFLLTACNAGPTSDDILNQVNDAEINYAADLERRSSYKLYSLQSNVKGMDCCVNLKEPLPETQNDWVLSHYSCEELSGNMRTVIDSGWFKLTEYKHPYQDRFNKVWYGGERCFVEALDQENLDVIFGAKIDKGSSYGMRKDGDTITVSLASEAVFTTVDEIVKYDAPGCTFKAKVKYRFKKHYRSKVDPEVLNKDTGSVDFCLVKDNKGNWLLAD